MNKLNEIKSWLEKIKAGGYKEGTIAFGDDAWQAVEYCGELVGMVEELRDKLNPRLWTWEMSEAWHTNIPDLYKAFEALRNAKAAIKGGDDDD